MIFCTNLSADCTSSGKKKGFHSNHRSSKHVCLIRYVDCIIDFKDISRYFQFSIQIKFHTRLIQFPYNHQCHLLLGQIEHIYSHSLFHRLSYRRKFVKINQSQPFCTQNRICWATQCICLSSSTEKCMAAMLMQRWYPSSIVGVPFQCSTVRIVCGVISDGALQPDWSTTAANSRAVCRFTVVRFQLWRGCECRARSQSMPPSYNGQTFLLYDLNMN